MVITGLTRNQLAGYSGTGVRIPSSPPKSKHPQRGCFDFDGVGIRTRKGATVKPGSPVSCLVRRGPSSLNEAAQDGQFAKQNA